MYLILELQKMSDTQVSVPQHTVLFVRDDGYLYDYRVYNHATEDTHP